MGRAHVGGCERDWGGWHAPLRSSPIQAAAAPSPTSTASHGALERGQQHSLPANEDTGEDSEEEVEEEEEEDTLPRARWEDAEPAEEEEEEEEAGDS